MKLHFVGVSGVARFKTGITEVAKGASDMCPDRILEVLGHSCTVSKRL